ncbi:MAG TPA: hypothetical protein PKH65_00100 [Bacteroidia bacterium]|nr:hypothetical protein [Bacteroidia bacterium]HNT79054.1 hypothetical protein [Bacteroidia bacterium]
MRFFKRFSLLTLFAFLLAFTLFSCKKTGPADALITVRDTLGKPVSGATVVLRQDSVVNPGTGAQANINLQKTTDSGGQVFFSVQWEAVLNIEASKGNLSASDYIRLEQSKQVDKVVVIK